MKNRQKYVTGFLFSKDGSQVALIRKNRPEKQKGLLNGIGGKVEPNEKVYDALIREVYEEAGLDTSIYPNKAHWTFFHETQSPRSEIHCFAGTCDLSKLKTKTDENIEIWNMLDIYPNEEQFFGEALWLIVRAKKTVFLGDKSTSYSHHNY